MRKLLQNIFRQPVIRLANRFSSRPDKERVFSALTQLYEDIIASKTKKGIVLNFDLPHGKFVILSDQHKGAKNGFDDFAANEKNYLAALDYYFTNQYYYINLGDSEELWENTLAQVKTHNGATFEKERLFLQDNRFAKLFGNHDLDWGNAPFASLELKSIYKQPVTIYEGIILQTEADGKPFRIFLTHGHQGDLQSDGNWFSKWFVAKVWAKIQAYLEINPNTPAYDHELKTEHNRLMYEWSNQNNMALITGHTHQPVFQSLTLLERLYSKLSTAQKNNDDTAVKELTSAIHYRLRKGEILPDFTGFTSGYFNSGCCCFDDGDITGIEICDGSIRLVKWEYNSANVPERIVLEEATLGNVSATVQTIV